MTGTNLFNPEIPITLVVDSPAQIEAASGADLLRRQLGPGFSLSCIDLPSIGQGHWFIATLGKLRKQPAGTITHTFGLCSLVAATLGAKGPIVFSPQQPLTRRQIGLLRAIASIRPVHCISPTATERHQWASRGVPAEHCHLIRPAVELGQIARRRNWELRRAIGLRDNDIALFSIGDATHRANHELAIWTAAILHELDERYRLILPANGPIAQILAKRATRVSSKSFAVSAAALGSFPAPAADFASGQSPAAAGGIPSIGQLLGAADVLICTALQPVPTLPVVMGMASGLPIIATATPTISELLEDHHTCLMVPKPTPRLLARRVMDVLADPQLQWTITDRAKTEAYEFFAPSLFLNQHRSLYRQLARGQAVVLEESAQGAGSKFNEMTRA